MKRSTFLSTLALMGPAAMLSCQNDLGPLPELSASHLGDASARGNAEIPEKYTLVKDGNANLLYQKGMLKKVILDTIPGIAGESYPNAQVIEYEYHGDNEYGLIYRNTYIGGKLVHKVVNNLTNQRCNETFEYVYNQEGVKQTFTSGHFTSRYDTKGLLRKKQYYHQDQFIGYIYDNAGEKLLRVECKDILKWYSGTVKMYSINFKYDDRNPIENRSNLNLRLDGFPYFTPFTDEYLPIFGTSVKYLPNEVYTENGEIHLAFKYKLNDAGYVIQKETTDLINRVVTTKNYDYLVTPQ
ncbi:hypothetical protein [Larkinella rosea]|uniref:DUF4595 domain-containing protein n=1 Tax=Larkinella rosea TaxID=2025312 RepID=A0A3P1BPC9_9BACT|nr:hypothetical protein [Larkinella rosea]RRB02895.1 hypothetical protein EHT25_20885 [Larkinella rosea]